ncbi:MAG: MSMEG_0568 family radical SAM protein [Herpetosiphon sp.]
MPSQQIILDLQSMGARIDVPVQEQGRRGGAGPSDDKAFMLAGVAAMVPTLGAFAHQSPYAVVDDTKGGYCLTHNGIPLMPVEFAPVPRFYNLKTAEGVSYRQLAVLHGQDVLATTVAQRCIRWRREGERCQFCAIERSLESGAAVALKTPEQLAEVAEAAVRLDGVRHMVLTTGTINYHDKGIRYLAKCIRAIKAVADIGIQAQFEPPDDLDDLQLLHAAGTDTVGMHMESFNQKTRERITPGKATISIERYFEAYHRAVDIFGRNQVSSYIIAGFGDSEDEIVEGCRRMAEVGVYPFIVPLRPIMDTPLENAVAPEPAFMQRIYRQVAANNLRYGLSYRNSKAGCTRCGACSGMIAFE